MKKNSSLSEQFIRSFFFFLILPLAVVFITFLVTIYDSNKNKVSQDLQIVSHAVANKVNIRLESPALYLSVIADALNAKHDNAFISDLISFGINKYHIFDSIYVLDNEKKVTEMSFSSFSKYQRSDFIGVKLNDVKGYGEQSFYWSSPFLSLVTNNYIVRLSVKYSEGYVVADLSLKFLSQTLLHTKMVDDTHVFIVDSKGDVISCSENTDNQLHENIFNHPVVEDTYKGGHIVFNYDVDGVKYVGSGYKIPITDWYLVLEQKESTAFKLFYEILYVTCASGLFIVFFIIMMLILIRKKIIKPIKLLTYRSEQFSRGAVPEFDAGESVFHELQMLYDSFDHMSCEIDVREKALRDKEEYFRTIFDSTTNTGILVLSADDENMITDANRGAQNISEYKLSELMGLPPAALVRGVGEDISRMRREALERNTMVTGRFEMTKKSGVHFPVFCTVHPVFGVADHIDAFIVVFIDITELTSVQKALESEKERLDVTLKSIGEGVLATDRLGRILLVNSSAENILGQKHKYLMGSQLKDVLQIYDYENGEDISSHLFASNDGGRKSFRANIVANHDSIITVKITSSAMLNIKGEIIGFVYVLSDISERIRMEKELINRKQQLEEINRNLEIRVVDETEKRRRNEQMLFEQSKFAAMGQMISAIAHQWRQPLNALALYIQDIEDAYAAGEVEDKYLHVFVKNSMNLINHMSVTIDDFRNFFHSSNVKEMSNLVDVVAQSISLVSTQLRSQNINFELAVINGEEEDVFANSLPEPDRVFGKDLLVFPSEIKQVLLNILQNARDAISEKRTKLLKKSGTIKITVDYKEDKVILVISNDGGNIPYESLASIFDPYFTTKAEGEGTGIGLYMSKIMIEDHMDGFLVAENIEEGVKFTITLYYNS